MKILKLFLLKICMVGLLIACATPRNEAQIIFTQEQMQRQYQEAQKNNLLAVERKKNGINVHEFLEFLLAQDKFEDMKREKIPDFLFREIDVRFVQQPIAISVPVFEKSTAFLFIKTVP